MSNARYRRRVSRVSFMGLLLAACLVPLSTSPIAAAAGSGDAAAANDPPRIYARSDYDSDRAAERKADRAARRERRDRRDRDNRAKDQVRGLERRLKRMERRTTKSRKGSRNKGDPAAGSHCMYGPDGRLIYSPAGSRCTATRDDSVVPDSGQAASGGEPSRVYPSEASKGPRAGSAQKRSSTTGCIRGGCQNGPGTYIWPDGSRYAGHFRNGLQHGQGTLIFADGSSYVGSWHAGKRSGQGTAMFADGRMQAGEWQDNRLVRPGSGPRSAKAPSWPNLSQPAPEVGGGSRDAAVIVGVEQYAHVADVPGAQLNASDWYRYLVKTRGVPVDRVVLLLDEDATREEMRWAAEDAARRMKSGGSLWFVFVGHGAPSQSGQDGLLVGFDAQQKARSISSRSLPRADLLAILEQSEADRITVVLDACFSGQAPGGSQLVAGLQPLVVTSAAPTADPRTTLMTAARSDQYAGPLPGVERPAFSYLLLGGLRGWADLDSNGQVSAVELDTYVSDAMRALIRGRRQDPTFIVGNDAALARSAREAGPDLAEMVLGASLPAAAKDSR